MSEEEIFKAPPDGNDCIVPRVSPTIRRPCSPLARAPVEVHLRPIAVPASISADVQQYFWTLSKNMCCLIGMLNKFQSTAQNAKDVWKVLRDMQSIFGAGECSVCRELFSDEETMFLPCGHAFHLECIQKWCLNSTHGQSEDTSRADDEHSRMRAIPGNARFPCPCCKIWARYDEIVKPFNAFPKKEELERFQDTLTRCLKTCSMEKSTVPFAISGTAETPTPTRENRFLGGLNEAFDSVSAMVQTLSTDLRRYASQCFNFGALERERIDQYSGQVEALIEDRDDFLKIAKDKKECLEKEKDILSTQRLNLKLLANELDVKQEELQGREMEVRRAERTLAMRRRALQNLDHEVTTMKADLVDQIVAFEACQSEREADVIDVDAIPQNSKDGGRLRLTRSIAKRRRT